MKKALFITLICVLTIYAPLELTRLILAYGLDFYTTFELYAFWFAYLVAVLMMIDWIKE